MTRKNAISHIWYTRCPVPTPVGLATQLGLLDTAFAAEGIKLNSIIDSKDRSIRSSHFDHHLDYSFRHGGNVPPIRGWSASPGQTSSRRSSRCPKPGSKRHATSSAGASALRVAHLGSSTSWPLPL